jgi:hypothetical protein
LREKKISNKFNRLAAAFTGSAQSFKFIHNNLQIQVHQSAAGPNPEAQEWEKNFK